VNAVRTFIDQDREGSIRLSVWNMLRHFPHEERMPDDEADWGRNLLGLYT